MDFQKHFYWCQDRSFFNLTSLPNPVTYRAEISPHNCLSTSDGTARVAITTLRSFSRRPPVPKHGEDSDHSR
jgi:hypothetical protein